MAETLAAVEQEPQVLHRLDTIGLGRLDDRVE
jgi:hypothetical protein